MPIISRLRKDLSRYRKTKFSRSDWVIFIVATVVLIGLSDYSKMSELARPTMYSMLVIWFVVKAKWELRTYTWFWFIVGVAVLVHILLITLTPWTGGWIPVLVAMPFLFADIVLLLLVIGIFEARLRNPRPETKDGGNKARGSHGY